jgi:hypothetical protein
MLACFALGTIIGLLGAICLAASLLSIQQALAKKRPIAQQSLSILGLPLFYGGGTWSRSLFIPADDIQRGSGIYMLMIMVALLIVNYWPCYRLVVWLGSEIASQGRRDA